MFDASFARDFLGHNVWHQRGVMKGKAGNIELSGETKQKIGTKTQINVVALLVARRPRPIFSFCCCNRFGQFTFLCRVVPQGVSMGRDVA